MVEQPRPPQSNFPEFTEMNYEELTRWVATEFAEAVIMGGKTFHSTAQWVTQMVCYWQTAQEYKRSEQHAREESRPESGLDEHAGKTEGIVNS